MDDPFKTFDDIRRAFLLYLDSPFRLRYEALMNERRALFNQDRQLYRDPLFEPIVPYESSGLSIHDACARLGVNAEAGEFISRGLFPTNRTLYRHQFEAWKESRKGRAVVVTSATSSGKTECYLIPVFAELVEESARGWGAPGQSAPFWWNGGAGRTSQRAHEPAQRPAALRALFLYPLNALIEDQLGRIREACDGPGPRDWMASNRPGHHFWFGRYTSATPVPGQPTNENKRTELRRRLRIMQRDWVRATASAAARSDARILTYFQDPAGSEMWSRWDMQDCPPDILITNYSMLNIMLMRGVEEAVFDRTRAWLEQDRANLFHLVVDELHSYRGTPGTEVGYLIRALLARLGLTPDSRQLRIIATSASIEDDADSRQYLEQFFGRDPDSFVVIPGDKQSFPPGPRGLAGEAARFVRAGSALEAGIEAAALELASPEQNRKGAATFLASALAEMGALEAVREAGELGPFTLEELARRVFEANDDEALAGAKGLVRCVVAARTDDDVAPLPLRVHYFFHNAGRLWACTNPDCRGRSGSTPVGADEPPVGRLYAEPRPYCGSCQAAVLELLYCQPCGEVLIGGFHKPDPDLPNAWFLSPDYPNLDRVPDRSVSLRRNFSEYMVFWPASGRRLAKVTSQNGPRWQWQQNRQSGWQWTPAVLEQQVARLIRPPRAQASRPGMTGGYVFISPDSDANAFPSKCPHCGADWARRRVGSPIRDLGSGFQRVVQLLCDALMRELDTPSRKLVLFSDSRSDAAKLSTGIKLAHHLDTLRQVAYEQLAGEEVAARVQYAEALAVHQTAVELAALEQRQREASLTQEEFAQRQRLIGELPLEVLGEILRHVAAGGVPPAALTPPVAPGGFASAPFTSLLNAARTRLLEVGMNPGGPQPSVTKYQPRTRGAPAVWWDALFNWNTSPLTYRIGLQPVEQQLRDQIEASLRGSMIQDVLFADGSRDFESLHLGFLWVNGNWPNTVEDQATASTIRMLAQRFRWTGSDAEGEPQPPTYIGKYLREVADRSGLNLIGLVDSVTARLGQRLTQWLIAPDDMQVLAPRQDADHRIAVYRCERCGRSHLHPSGGVCTTCLRPLSATPLMCRVDTDEPEDFYEFLARSGTQPFRLHCEELTGQTNGEDRIARQRRFQEVFLAEESALAAGVDLLSVTTTMEAGVDIGSLQAIALANMPPVRFNYQQRVGRAGRRGLGMAAALTLCRGRSHDDYYFERPRLITAEPPPTPYVDVSREGIAERVVNKEVLRRAFGGIDLPARGDNVHGEFGTVAEWPQHRPVVESWIANHAGEVDSVCQSILRRTAMDSAEGRAAMAAHVRGDLLQAIDDVTRHRESLPHLVLSERLASMGVLPMFGLPTRVRYLYHEGPSPYNGWPPDRGVIDRQLDIAISQFAPGAQTVKDDELHTSVGVVDYRPFGDRIVTASDPLADAVEVGVCRQCQALVPEPAALGGCPYCSASRSDTGYRTVKLSEPPGFTTWFLISAEFSGGFEFTPRALRARIGSSSNPATAARNFTIDAGSQRVYRVNDNDGSDFVFQKLANQDIWITERAFSQALQDLPLAERSAISAPRYDLSEQPLRRALAAIANTDVLTAGIADVPVGLCLNPAIPEARAGWYSLGFLVRRAAAVWMDVAESELDLGIQPVMDFTSPFAPPSARIFLSDALENGAGYCTHLGEPGRFEGLLEFIVGSGIPPDDSFWRPLVDAPHEEECASSCHRCLREFGNMAYHPLLDWRTGLDMVRLALDPHAEIDLRYPYWATLVNRISGPYFSGLGLTAGRVGGLDAGIDQAQHAAVVLMHPLWDRDRTNLRADVAAAVAEGERQGIRVELRSVLRAVRFPYE
jgi:DEAD/DEAH box helicase domain-containing protein